MSSSVNSILIRIPVISLAPLDSRIGKWIHKLMGIRQLTWQHATNCIYEGADGIRGRLAIRRLEKRWGGREEGGRRERGEKWGKTKGGEKGKILREQSERRSKKRGGRQGVEEGGNGAPFPPPYLLVKEKNMIKIEVCKTLMPPLPNTWRVCLTLNLALWPTDLNINRDHLIIKNYVPSKFEASGAKHCWVTSFTRCRRLTWPLTLTFDLLTWISIGIICLWGTISLPSLRTKHCWVISCTRRGRLIWTLTFALLTWISIGII